MIAPSTPRTPILYECPICGQSSFLPGQECPDCLADEEITLDEPRKEPRLPDDEDPDGLDD